MKEEKKRIEKKKSKKVLLLNSEQQFLCQLPTGFSSLNLFFLSGRSPPLIYIFFKITLP
jgi:hypothetical protein